MQILQIKQTDNKYPQNLLKIKDCPKKLYALGDINLLNKKSILAIVGSRKCSEYGRQVANEFAKELSKQDITIISGMALGIDSASHIGAMSEQGKTIAVLGCGLNYIYPKENEWLFYKILSNGGCIITEYKENIEPNTSNFPKRNRIISGIAKSVLVVEAEHRSGSTITANYAKQQGKTVYAIPNNIYINTGIGTNKLIQNGANLVTKPSQIKKDFVQKFNNQKPSQVNSSKLISKIPQEYVKIYSILEKGPMHINEIAKQQEKSLSELNAIMVIMEIEGYIQRLNSNIYKRKE